jgi:hypothetical protein
MDMSSDMSAAKAEAYTIITKCLCDKSIALWQVSLKILILIIITEIKHVLDKCYKLVFPLFQNYF